MSKILALLAVTLLVLPAADGAKAGEGGKGLGLRQRLLQKFDSDGDGKLSDSERAAAKAACIAKWDTDGDGKLSDSERAAARAAFAAKLKEKHPKLFAKIDSNGDGVLSKEEVQAARAWLREHRGERGQGRDRVKSGE